MKKMKRVLAAALCAVTACSALSLTACGNKAVAPDYSGTEETFDIWAYHATYNGWWRHVENGETIEDREGIVKTDRESLLEYKAAGFNRLFINYAMTVSGDSYAESDAKKVMDICADIGLKCILFESKLHGLSSTRESLINPDKADGNNFFASQEDLNDFVGERIKDMIKHPAFDGFSLKDEPHRDYLPAIGQVYKAIQAAAPGCFVNMNLWGYSENTKNNWQDTYSKDWVTQTAKENYIDYLDTYLECTGAPYVQYDTYPLYGENEYIAETGMPTAVSTDHFKNYEIVAEWCAEKGVEFKKVLQTSSYATSSDGGNTWNARCRKPTKTDMRWQTNIGMAFGQKTFTYWTYYPVVNTGSSEKYDETACFVDQYGNKNDMYNWMKAIHGEMHLMAQALMNFEFVKATPVIKNPAIGQIDFLTPLKKKEMELITPPKSATSGVGVVTELYDEENDRYGYFIVNVTDPTKNGEMEISFSVNGYNNVQVYYRGDVENQKLEDGVYTVALETGDGVFVIPY